MESSGERPDGEMCDGQVLQWGAVFSGGGPRISGGKIKAELRIAFPFCLQKPCFGRRAKLAPLSGYNTVPPLH
jgi:hypothetical protein